MERMMSDVKVFVGTRGHVVIAQTQYGMNDDAAVSMHPDQVDTIIRWLQEVKKEAQEFVPEPE